MTDESELRRRLAAYVADEPGLGLSMTDIISRGRRDRRRQRVLAVGAGAAATIVVGASACAFEAVSDNAGSGQIVPSAPARSTGHDSHPRQTHGPAQTVTASADIPAAIRAVVADDAPGFSTETAMVASTWQAYDPRSNRSGQPPSLSPNQYEEATSWVALLELPNGTSRLMFELDHLPPDKPAGIFDASCSSYAKGECEQRTLADGRRVVETYSANTLRQGDGFLTDHTIDVVNGDYRVLVTETVTDASSTDPHQQYELSPQDLLAMASDQRLVFPEPSPLPPLPSWERCLYGSNPPPDCP